MTEDKIEQTSCDKNSIELKDNTAEEARGFQAEIASQTHEVVQPQPLTSRYDRWKRDLLDITLRNPLINFKLAKAGISLAVDDTQAVVNALSHGSQLLIIPKSATEKAAAAAAADKTEKAAAAAAADKTEKAAADKTEKAAAAVSVAAVEEEAVEGAADSVAPEVAPATSPEVAPEVAPVPAPLEEAPPATPTKKTDLENNKIKSTLAEEELSRRLVDIFRKARLTLEESGASPLFVAVGFLKWRETDKPKEDRYAPLVLLPVELTRKSARTGYSIAMTGDEATINLSLVEMLRANFKIDISALSQLPLSEGGSLDYLAVKEYVSKRIEGQNDFEVVDALSIGLFTYSSFVLWNDLIVRENVLHQHPLTGSLINGCNDERLYASAFDAGDNPYTYLPMDADSSQIKAVCEAGEGKSFVLFGPPGTGKSQTITNIIANALAKGKKILFVAEKTAALNVVKKRLERLGLWDFCLELHSNKVQKRLFYEQFDKVLELAENAKDVSYEEAVERLNAAESELEVFASAMNKKRPINISVFEAVNKVLECGDDVDTLDIERTDISYDELDKAFEALKNLADIGAVVGEPLNSDFYHSAVTEYSFSLRESVSKLAKEITGSYTAFTQAIGKISEFINASDTKAHADFKKYQPLTALCETFASAVNYSKKGGFNNFFAFLFSANHKSMRKSWYYRQLRQFIKNHPEEAGQILSAINAFILPERQLRDILKYGNAYQGGEDYALEIAVAAEGFLSSIHTLKDYCLYNQSKSKCAEHGVLTEIAAHYHEGEANSDELEELFKKSFWQSWLIDTVSSDPILNTFSPGEFAAKRERFKAFTEHVANISKKEIYLKMAMNLPNFKYASMASSEPGILMRAVKNRGRGITIRGLFDRIPNLINNVKPCMLMSPLSAAQYLSPNFPPFDMVVFDEASQLLTCEAVGAISRGKSTIVVGDPNQLPPTTFFRAMQDDDVDFAYQDMESILDDMLTLNLPQNKLLWHYRSEHESLIAFSNNHYYEGSLITFPSPDDTNSRVTFKKIEGIYERGTTRTNRKEAEAIVAELFNALSDPERAKLSYGIVTFNITQQNLIEDLIDKRLAKQPQFEKYFNSGENPIFIKNIESVQGDERDVIIFSVTYGVDREGKMTVNFGPINKDGGWRRLNVALTRACKQIIVYSTITPDMIDCSRTSARGVRGLKEFLSFAIDPAEYFLRQRTSSPSDLVRAVAADLTKAGYKVAANLGRSSNKIDIAVRGSDGNFVLGIICDDGGQKHSEKARDREYGRESFYRRLKWNMTRVYALEFWQNREEEIKRLISILEGGDDPDAAILSESTVAEIKAQAVEIDFNPNIPLPSAKYEEFKIGHKRTAAKFYIYQSLDTIIGQIKKIIEVEAPVSEQSVKRKIAAAWNIPRQTQKFSAYVDSIIHRISPVSSMTETTKFFWGFDGQGEMTAFRTGGGRRVEDIPKEEFAVAAYYIMQNALSINSSDLIRETARLFGFTKTPSAVKRIVEALILLIDTGKINKTEDTYTLKK